MGDEEEAPAEVVVPTVCKPEILSFCLVGKIKLLQDALEADPIMVNLGSEKRGFMPLQVATIAQRNYEQIIDVLMAAGADLKIPNKVGQTAFHTAADKDNDASLIKLLSLEGAKEAMDLQDEDGHTALHYAAWSGKAAPVLALLRAGANTELTNADGNKPLDEANAKGHQQVIEYLTNGPPPEEAEEAAAE